VTAGTGPFEQPTTPPVPFHRPSIDETDIAAVVAAMRSGWITTGPLCRQFEAAFAEHLGGGVEALAVNSCTAALHLALEAAGLGEGDLVVTSAYTFTATAEVVRYLGAHPVFADVDSSTGNITADSVAEAVARLPPAARGRVKALVPVHFAGLPCDMTALADLASQQGWFLVDDAAHALPARHSDRPIGRWGDATAFSFYATKTLCTGEGGMVVTSRPELAARMRVMRLHGISRDAFDRYAVADGWRYEVVAPGFKYNLSDMAAALGLSQLRRLDQMRRARAALAAAYDMAFADLDGVAPPAQAPAAGDHAWHLYALRLLDGQAVRDQVVRELAAAGVGSSVHFIPLHLQPYYRDAYGLRPGDFPNATRLFGEELSLPLFPGMTEGDVSRVIELLPWALSAARRGRRSA
jgi:dTDP-4-amino-4,6-dideoxygalactose transaminase